MNRVFDISIRDGLIVWIAGVPILAVLAVSFIAGLMWLVAEFVNGLGAPER